MTPDLPPPDASLVAYVTEACGAERVDVHWLGMDPARLPEDTDALVWQGEACRSRPALRLVALRRGEVAARFAVRPSLTVWVRAPVAAVDLSAGQAIEVASGLVPVDTIVGERVSEGVARVDLAAGAPLTTAVVAPPLDARSGDRVDVVVRRGALSITAEGRLLEDGRRGDRVRVANTATREVLRGVLVDPRTVEVGR